jgi:hypothetical protein
MMRLQTALWALALSFGVTVFFAMGSRALAGGTPLGTAFTYQGEFKVAGVPATGSHHLRFQLWDALIGGAQVGGDVDAPTVAMTEGRFTVPLDFGVSVFDGSARWLQVAVVTNGGATVTTLAPRHPITATPYALQTRGISVDSDGEVGIGTADPLEDLHVASPAARLRLEDTNSPGGGYTLIYDAQPTQLRFSKTNNNGSVLFDMNPIAADGISDARVRFFRETTTTGAKSVDFLRGDGSNSASAAIGIDGADSFFQIHGGNIGIGTTTPTAKLAVTGSDRTIEGISTGGGIGSSIGVYGESASSTGTGVRGVTTNNVGVSGKALGTTDSNVGVLGDSSSPTGNDFYAAGAGVNYGSSSSIRWKRNIEAINDPLAMLAAMRGVYFDWDAEHGGHHDVGMIAEEVGKVLPEIVTYEDNGIDASGMDYSKLTPLLVEAVKALRAEKDRQIQAQQEQIDAQARVIEHQQAAIDELLRRLKALERRVAE